MFLYLKIYYLKFDITKGKMRRLKWNRVIFVIQYINIYRHIKRTNVVNEG